MTQLPRSLKTLALTSVVISVLSACSTATLIGSGVAAGAAADFAVDRRLAEVQVEDTALELRIKQRANSLLKQYNPQTTTSFSVISYNRKILLIGQAANPQEKRLIQQVASSDPKVSDGFNYIDVSPMPRTVSDINQDTWITSKVRTRLLASGGVYPGHVKVATFNRVVYVLGLLTPAQQAATTQIVRTTTGVRGVITLYEPYYPARNQTHQYQ